jgi:hypothetical protein
LGGTLAVTSGGTGATTSDVAINNLLPSQSTHAGKYLITDGTNVSWSTSGANLSIVNDSSTNATRYLTFTDVTTGVITQEYVSSAGLTFNPSSSTLSATNFVGALTGNATTATTATRATNLAGGASGSLPYQSASGTTTFLAAGTNGQYLVLSGGVPTWTSVSTVSSFSGGTTGLTPSTATTGAVTLAGTLTVANGGTGVNTSSGASSVVLRDANANITGNILFSGFTNTAAAGTTTTLTASSTPNWVITGSGGQTFQLPNATTLTAGIIYSFNNNQTSGAITVNNASGTLVVSVPSGGYTVLTLLTNGTSAGTWDYHFQAPANVSWSTNTFSYPGSITSATWNATAIGAIYGGTAQTTYTTGDTLYASASNTLSKLAIGSTGQVLTVAGGVPTWANTTPATTITDDTTTASTRYINFTSATSGSLSTIYTSSTKLQYNPSTGALTSTSLTPTNALGTTYGGTGVTTSTGSGNNVLSTSPTLVTPVLGTPTSVTLTNATGLPLTTGVTGTLATTNGGTGLTSFTSGGVVYASSTSALTTGSGLVFDGTNLGIGVSSPAYKLDVQASGYPGINVASTLGSGANGAYFQAKNGGGAASFFGTETTTGGYTYTGAIANSAYIGPEGANPLQLVTNGIARATIDSSGNLGLGVTPSASSSGGNFNLSGDILGGSAVTLGTNWYFNGGFKYKATGTASRLYLDTIGGFDWYSAPSGTAGNAITFTQAMTLDASGNLFVGATALGSNANYFAFSPSNEFADFGHVSGTASGVQYTRFLYNGSSIGSITQSGTTAVLYNVTSDQRLKENIVDADSASNLIDSLQVRQYDWKSDGSHQRYGFIAQELVTVAPEAVHQPTDPDDMMAVDYSKLVPMLVKEIQSLRKRILTLENK